MEAWWGVNTDLHTGHSILSVGSAPPTLPDWEILVIVQVDSSLISIPTPYVYIQQLAGEFPGWQLKGIGDESLVASTLVAAGIRAIKVPSVESLHSWQLPITYMP